MNKFYMYILKCSDASYYIGHTDNLEMRISAHKRGTYSCYTKNRLPIEVVFVQEFTSRYEALAAERKVKRWTRAKKEALMRKDWNMLSLLSRNKADIV